MNEIPWDEELFLRESRRQLKSIVDVWRKLHGITPSNHSLLGAMELEYELERQIKNANEHLCNVQDLH